jgi:glycosyltransferase involved in cell wall biosynthesis
MMIGRCVLTFDAGAAADKKRLKRPLVSIIVPTYNRLDQLKRALKSILQQTYDHYEVIVIDDASDDGTADWIFSVSKSLFLRPIRLIRLRKRSGAAKARNAGLKVARGELVAFLDADDLWRSDYLEFQVAALSCHLRSTMSFCDVWVDRTAIGGVCKKQAYLDSIHCKDLIERLLLDNFISTMSAVVIRRKQLKIAGFLDEKFLVVHDRELYIRLLQLGGHISHVPQALVVKRQESDSLTSDFSLWAQDARRFFKVFFADRKNDSYGHLKELAKRNIEICIQRRSLQARFSFVEIP